MMIRRIFWGYVSDEVEIEAPKESEDETVKPKKGPASSSVGGGLASIFEMLARLNATEQEREQEMQFYFAKTNEFYDFLKSEGKFMAMLRSTNFTRDEVEKEYGKLVRRFIRQTEEIKVKKLIEENKEMFLEDFKIRIVNSIV